MPRVFVSDEHTDEPSSYVHTEYRPELSSALLHLGITIYEHTRLPARVVEAARVRTAQINGCRTCQTWRAERDLPGVFARRGRAGTDSFLYKGGSLPDSDFYAALDQNWRDSTVFNERERLAIEHAERMGIDPHSFDDAEDFWRRMHEHFDDGEIVDLTLCIAGFIAGGRFLHTLDIDPAICAMAPASRGTLGSAGAAPKCSPHQQRTHPAAGRTLRS
jgi:alkylhydroperoxidase family enzyme